MDKELRDIENTSRLEIAIGVSLSVGDEVHFFTEPSREQILKGFLRPMNPKNEELWINSRNQIEWGKIEAISYEQKYYVGPEIQVRQMWFPLALVEIVNGVEINWAEMNML